MAAQQTLDLLILVRARMPQLVVVYDICYDQRKIYQGMEAFKANCPEKVLRFALMEG